MCAAAGRQPISLDWADIVETYPTTQPMVNVAGIATFATHFPGGWEGAGVPDGVAADVAFLRSWALPEECYYGNTQVGLHPFIAEPAVRPHTAGLPTASEVLADLLVKDFVSRPDVALDAANIPYVERAAGAFLGGDQIHTDGGAQFMFCTDPVEVVPHAETEEDLPAMQASVDALTALRSYVVDGHVYFVVAHTVPVGEEDLPFPNLVLLWAVGVSPASGHLVGGWGVQACHNLCD
eukprot:TRINITY_DN8828_c0_g1_i1.p1 TRINITY_DN8828_c0_g1~~TRINITY_DN8828_c0_g1_i1.p1  ORF type:complete len:237 (-),score=68.61 TRINITY_DN8828_c0_g1_i1:192-902(-)